MIRRLKQWWAEQTDEATKEKTKRMELRGRTTDLVDHDLYEAARPGGELFWGEGNIHPEIVFATARPSEVEMLFEPGPLRDAWQEVCRGLDVPCTKQEAYFTSMMKHERLVWSQPLWERLRQSFDAEIAMLAPKVVVAMGDWGGLSIFPGMSLAASGGRMKVERMGDAAVTFIASEHPSLLLGDNPHARALIETPLSRAAEVLHRDGLL